jgi:hypothetical protein
VSGANLEEKDEAKLVDTLVAGANLEGEATLVDLLMALAKLEKKDETTSWRLVMTCSSVNMGLRSMN